MSLSLGLTGRCESIVNESNTAAAVGSGLLPVFSTPMMVALMEGAAVNAIADHLSPGESSVGIHLDIAHTSATPIGMAVWAEAELTAIDGRTLTFSVSAYDSAGPIGHGTHQRVCILPERFLAKAQQKSQEH